MRTSPCLFSDPQLVSCGLTPAPVSLQVGIHLGSLLRLMTQFGAACCPQSVQRICSFQFFIPGEATVMGETSPGPDTLFLKK